MKKEKYYCSICHKETSKSRPICNRCSSEIYNTRVKNIEYGKKEIVIDDIPLEEQHEGIEKSKWIALLLCATICGHKFYEEKYFMGILYFLTFGFLGIGTAIDVFKILAKPNPYYIKK